MPPFQKTPQILSPLQMKLISLACLDCHLEYQLTPVGTYDSPVAPGGNATDPCVNTTGSMTLLIQLRRKVDVHFSTRDEA